ncbi:MAG TPA: uroporphyrinogen decarboxylase, partial [Pirellulaceae bacterium]
EVPLSDNPVALDFVHRMVTGQVDVAIFLTGVGFQHLLAFAERHIARDRFLAALSDAVLIARGPKPVAAMRAVGIEPHLRVPEPNTWRELLRTIDEQLSISNLQVAVQEYGLPNTSLIAGLEARGGRVLTVPVYTWEFPEDTGPLRENVRAIFAGERDLLLFTSAHQVTNVIRMSDALGLRGDWLRILPEVVVVSIGPTTSEALRSFGWPVDLVPSRPKLGPFVREAALHGRELRRRKRRIVTQLTGPSADVLDSRAPWYESPFMKACRRESTEVTPIWLMRQAGRYLPEYRALRAEVGFLDLCKQPALCAEIMVATVNTLEVDAAIIFSDLLPILEPMGMELEYGSGEGPRIHNPVRDTEDVDRVQELDDIDALDFVFETVRLTRAALPHRLPLIGFSGAPFTLASYAIEGGGSRGFLHTKTLMYRDEGAWKELMRRLARAVTRYLNAQIRAGAQCVQLFDSWVGCLSPEDYRRYVLPYVSDVVANLAPGVPVIQFATGNPALLPLLVESNPTVVGVDWRISLDDAWKRIGWGKAIQGNLDPAVLLAEPGEIARQARMILRQAGGRPGHIFNLGHGVLPQTPPDHVRRLIDEVHRFRAE